MQPLSSILWPRWGRLVLWLLPAALLLALTGLASAAPALNLTVNSGVPTGESAQPGEVVTATVTLQYSGGSAPIDTGVLVTLTEALEPIGQPVLTENPTPSVDARVVRQRSGVVAWQGKLRNDGQLTLHIPVRVGRCWSGFRSHTITATALNPAGGVVQASAALSVHCPLATLDDIHVTQRVLWENQPAWAPYLPGLLPGHPLTLRTTFRNDAPVPVLLGVGRPRLLTTTAAGADAASDQRITLLALAPGASRSVDHVLHPSAALDAVNLLDGEVALRIGLLYCLVTGDGSACANTADAQVIAAGECGAGEVRPSIPCPDPGEIPDPTGEITITIPLHPNDLGDAPDSTNHAGQTMNAYPGVVAQFPTVFNELPGAPRGPLHRYPRPVHLGAGVSMEAEADAGPDADPSNNLLPTTDIADRDRLDDGLNLATLSLVHCQPARLQVGVGVMSNRARQALLNHNIQTLYLNVWVDGNRDGDWNDASQCSPAAGDVALEHIVIDYPIAVNSLSVGANVRNITGGKALWPQALANQPGWVRVTLSEAKSPKLPGRTYGDGRGPDAGYRLGETEDTLWMPASKADVEVTQHVEWGFQPTSGGVAPTSVVQFRIAYKNRGAATARNVQITQNLSGFGASAQLAYVTAPGLDSNAIQAGANQVSFQLGDLPAGASGAIVVGWRPQPGVSSAAAEGYGATVNAVSSNDDNSGNNSATASAVESAPLQMGFRTANSPVLLQRGATCRTAVTLAGVATPGKTLQLNLDGVDLAVTPTADAQGRWEQALSGLSDGLHVVRAAYAAGGAAATVQIRVDTGLLLDPASFTVTDAAGRTFAPDTLGRTWRSLPLANGGVYQVGVNACTAIDAPTLTYSGEMEKNCDFTDPDGDGRYTCTLTTGVLAASGVEPEASQQSNSAASLRLTATSATRALTFDITATSGAAGVVVDANTGAPLAGAQVLLLAVQPSTAAGVGDFGDLPVSDAFGQANPQTTGADGAFFFAPPPGVYRLAVTAPGYQRYRSATVESDDAPIAATLRLTPVVNEPADVVVVMGEEGFDADALTAPPGVVMEWVNSDLAEHSVRGDAWKSGVLWPGESFRLRFDQPGSFTYTDGENPLNDGSVTVEVNAPMPGTRFVYMPIVRR